MNKEKIESVVNLSYRIINVTKSIIILGLCLWFFIEAAEVITRIMITPFAIVAVSFVLREVFMLIKEIKHRKEMKKIDVDYNYRKELEEFNKKSEKVDSLTSKISIFAFLLFWFGFLIVADYLAIISWNDNGSIIFFFSFIFWIAGIIVARKALKK